MKEITRLQPAVIVASGDFTEKEITAEYESAAEHLLELDIFRLVRCPGNNDYRSTGILLD